MTQDELLDLAKKAGVVPVNRAHQHLEPVWWSVTAEDLERFAALVVAAEREAGKADCRVKALEAIIRRQQFIEDRYEELMLSARRCWRYYGADQQMFDASLHALDFLIRRHATEIDEMDGEDADAPSNA